jgi:hydrogenase maturation protein HypF
VVDDMVLDMFPLIGRLADTSDAGFGAALFHSSLARGLADWTVQAARRTGLTDVALSGGCFMNRVLAQDLERLLGQAGIKVYEACQLPPNDGGISAGQAWVALMGRRE